MAQRVAAPLDKNDPELRAILAEIEADAEKARLKAKIPGMSIVIVHDQDVLLSKGFGYADLDKKIPAGLPDGLSRVMVLSIEQDPGQILSKLTVNC